MGRKSRAKRGRPQPLSGRSIERPRKRASRSPGARVARVAVDDETWAAFRELCGETPASVRLGELVAAEVERSSHEGSEAPDALAALRAIHDQVTVLETYVREAQASDGGEAQ